MAGRGVAYHGARLDVLVWDGYREHAFSLPVQATVPLAIACLAREVIKAWYHLL